MADVTIVPEETVARLLVAGPQKFGMPEAFDFFERTSGAFDPPPVLLRQTIDAVFWASLSNEEGRPALARVLFADTRSPHCRLQPRPVSPAALCKLSPLLDVTSNALLLRRNGNLVGVGQWQNGDFGIVARRPGMLAVLDSSVVLGVFERGSWVIVGGSSVNVSCIVQQVLPHEEPRNRLLKAILVLRLAVQARQTGRGATFILAPRDQLDGIGSLSHPVEEFPALPHALEAWQRTSTATPPLAEQEQMRVLARSAIAIAAGGAGIDGATVIDASDLRLRGFGAKINARDDAFKIQLTELPSRQARTITKEESGGMRHQTAARLVRQNHAAIVITVSQDGPVSLFAWDAGQGSVVMIGHLDRYLEAEASFDPGRPGN